MGLARWLAASALVVLVVPSRAAFPMLAVAALAAAASRWSVRRVARGLEVSCDVPRWVDHGQAVTAVAALGNASRVPAPWVEFDVPCGMGLGRAAPHREVLPLSPGERLVREVPLVGTERGRHRVGPPRLRVGDVFGTADVTLAADEPAEVVVFPRVVPLARLGLPSASPLATLPAPRSVLVDQTSVVGTRDYAPGDAFATIHWPATARSGHLAVKEYERAQARDTMVVLDLSSSGYRRPTRPAAELAITVAASVARHAVVEQRQAAGLLTASPGGSETVTHLPAATGAAHLRAVLEALALVSTDSGPPLAELLARLERGLPAGTTVLAVTGTVSDEARVALLRLVRRGMAVAVALAGPAAGTEPAVPGLPAYRVAELPAVPAALAR